MSRSRPARLVQVPTRRQRRIARGDDHLVQRPDLASANRIPRSFVTWVETPVEPNLHRRLGSGNAFAAQRDALKVEVDRLFAQRGFAGGRSHLDVVGVSRRRRGDQHGVDVTRAENVFRRASDPSSLSLRDFVCRGRVDVIDHRQRRARMASHIGRVHPPNSSTPKHRNSQHSLTPRSRAQFSSHNATDVAKFVSCQYLMRGAAAG
jgi:hypothetical protein